MRDSRPLASRNDVAEYLGVPTTTLAQWAHRDIGPAYIRVGRYAKYRWADVESWVETRPRGGGGTAN